MGVAKKNVDESMYPWIICVFVCIEKSKTQFLLAINKLYVNACEQIYIVWTWFFFYHSSC